MQTVILTIHLILALLLIGIVLLQRSEGGGLGIGGGGASTAGRSAANALTKLTWAFGIAFVVTSLTLTIMSSRKKNDTLILDSLSQTSPESSDNSILTIPPDLLDLPVNTDVLLPLPEQESLPPPAQ